MEKFIQDIEHLMLSSDRDRYIQLRFFLDTMSQSDRFLTNIAAREFSNIRRGDAYSINTNKPIDIKLVYDALSEGGSPHVKDIVALIADYGDNASDHRLLSELKKCYVSLNSLRNAKYYSLKNNEDPDISMDGGRMVFAFGENMYYDIFVDGQLYLPKLSDSLVMNKILRETTIAGKIKGARKHFKEELAKKTMFRKCLGL